jgi:hypothetical protein
MPIENKHDEAAESSGSSEEKKRISLTNELDRNITGDDDFEEPEEDEEVLQLLSDQVNALAASVTSLRKCNEDLTRSLGDVHEENNELMQNGWYADSHGFSHNSKPPVSALEPSTSKHVRLVSVGENDESLNSQEIQKLILEDALDAEKSTKK